MSTESLALLLEGAAERYDNTINPRLGRKVPRDSSLLQDFVMLVIPQSHPDGFIPPRMWNRRHFVSAVSGVLAAGVSSVLSASETLSLDPRDFGLDIPPGKLALGDGRRVTTSDATGEAVVARVHVDVGDQRIVLLPDGQLVSRSQADAPLTDRPFIPLAKSELAKRLLTGKLNGFRSKETKRYLYLYNTSENFALATSKILESMFPGIAAFYEGQKLGAKSTDLPLVVIMFRTEAEFQAYQRMPAGVVAYYNVLTNHVVMYEESKLARLKPELAIQQSISTIAHEGVHQILNNIGVQERLSVWPMWLGEGLAEYFAPTTVGKKLAWKGAGQVNDLRMYELEVYLKSRAADAPSGQMVSHTVSAARLTSTGYASAWALTTYLAKTDKAAFNRYVAEISKLGPLEGNMKVAGRGVIPENLTIFQKFFGDDLAGLESKLVSYLKRLPYDDPFAEWPHYAAFVSATVEGKPRREANVFHTSDMAEKWQREAVEKLPLPARNSAQIAVREYGNRPLAERAASEFLKGR